MSFLIYHIRYISTYLPAVRLVLGTMRATHYGKSHFAPFPKWLYAPFRIWHLLHWGCSLLPPPPRPNPYGWPRRHIRRQVQHEVQHDCQGQHHRLSPPLIEGCGLRDITHPSTSWLRMDRHVVGPAEASRAWQHHTTVSVGAAISALPS
jgi:hypothetical protein